SAWSKRAPGTRRLFLTVAVLTWLITAGSGPLFYAYVHLPTGNWFRFPQRLFVVTIFACATLAGFAVRDVIDSDRLRPVRFLALAVSVTGICLVLDPAQRWFGIAVGTMFLGTRLAAPTARAARVTAAYMIALSLLVEVLATAPDPLARFDSITSN